MHYLATTNHEVEIFSLTKGEFGVFEDEWALTFEDRDSRGEQRFITIGTDFLDRILVIVYTHRKDDLRLISARIATKSERKEYEQRRI